MPLPTFQRAEEPLDYAARQLSRAVADPKHPWHWPVLATAGPAAQVVVLRGFDRAAPAVTFYTDARSAKVGQLDSTGGACELLFYHPRHRIQLRVSGAAAAVAQERERRRRWERQSDQGRRSYATVEPPGTPLERPGDGLPSGFAPEPSDEQLARAFANFAVYEVAINRADLLQLGREGQRRCRWEGDWSVGSSGWVTP